AKGLGGGFPIGAMLALTPEATGALAPGSHGTTFGGNPLATAAGLATIRALRDEDLLTRAREVGAHLREGLAATPGIGAVRGRGLLIGADLTAPDDERAAPAGPDVVAAARRAGFIINATGPNTLRLAPPLVLTADQARTFLDALPGILADAAPAD
ncbi:acetylornithine aminotransferase, partial [Rothia kristinae]